MNGKGKGVFCSSHGISINFGSGVTSTRFLLILIGAAFLFPFRAGAFAADDPVVVRTFQVTHASVQRLDPILQPLLSESGSLSIDMRTNSVVVKDASSCIRSIEQTIAELDVEMPSHTFYLNYADPNSVAKRIRRVLGPAGKTVEADGRTHTVYVMTTPSRLEHIKSLVAGWDRPDRRRHLR